MREDLDSAQHPTSEHSHPTTSQPFVDISSLGLRRGKRKRNQSTFYGFLIMATALQQSTIYNGISQAYNGYL